MKAERLVFSPLHLWPKSLLVVLDDKETGDDETTDANLTVCCVLQLENWTISDNTKENRS